MLFAVYGEQLTEQKALSFTEIDWLERSDLQRLVRANPAVLGEDLLIIAEEFGDWQDARRRIDLLALDRDGQLVVIELKRTDDGGHMDLQALRYAAMVSAMTFDQVVDAYSAMRMKSKDVNSDGPDTRSIVAQFIGAPEDESSIEISSRTRIILASRNFNVEITTTVLWLNDFYGTDIKCIRMTPYKLEGTIYLDVQQVIPLPEAQDYQVKIREKEASRERSNVVSSGRDQTRYRIIINGAPSEPLNKRQAALMMVKEFGSAGVSYDKIARLLPPSALLNYPGQLTEREELLKALRSGTSRRDPEIRFFIDDPLIDPNGDQTWVLSNQWQREEFERAFQQLVDNYPDKGITYRAAGKNEHADQHGGIGSEVDPPNG